MSLRLLFRAINGVSPRLAAIIRESYFTLNGWRFADLKSHIDHRLEKTGANPLSMQHSYRQIIDDDLNPDRIAFITNLPPDETGIATCSFYSWFGHSGAVDILCPVSDVDWYFSNGLRLNRASKNQVRVLDVGAFLTADQTNHYKTIIISVGNSNHCIYIHDVLKKAATVGTLDRFVLYVHDPCLLNLVQRGTSLPPAELVSIFESIYERQLPVSESDLASDDAVRAALVRLGVFGVRYFLNAGIERYLVNSRAAFDLVSKDLASSSAQVMQVFHPAFLPAGADHVLAFAKERSQARSSELLVIGTFGVPGQAKMTHRIIGAAQELRRRGIPVRLIIAGYNVRQYIRSYASELAGLDVLSYDGPTDLQLLQCMAEVDVAVQFRDNNLGESSGIVPQLLCLGKNTLVSDTGSFSEFGSAVKVISNDIGIEEVAGCILDLWRSPPPPENVAEYIKMHSAASFRQKLFEYVSQ